MTTSRVGFAVHAPSVAGHRRREYLLVGLLTALAALLRFLTLDTQSFEGDELVTAWLLQMDLSELLRAVPRSESTPHLYYVLAWGWTKLFGHGEVGVRSLSALLGTATVPIAYRAASVLLTRRSALIAAGLIAVNPLLVWFSQEARSHALLIFLSTLGLLYFARVLIGATGALRWWSIASALALLTHYFAIFLVAPEALWLALRSRGRRVKLAISLPLATALALLPLLLRQRRNPGGFEEASLARRAAQVPKNFLVAFNLPAETVVTLAAGALAAVGLLLVVRAKPSVRRGAAICGVVGASGVIVPIALALLGIDYVLTRNMVAALVPLALVLAAGYGVNRLGLAAAAALCALALWSVLTVATEPRLQRLNWRGAVEALGRPRLERALVVTPYPFVRPLTTIYLEQTHALPDKGARVREVALVALATQGRFSGKIPKPPPADPPPRPPPGFVLVERLRAETFTIVRYQARAPREVFPRNLQPLRLDRGEDAFLGVQAPVGRLGSLRNSKSSGTH